jgi:hypothetical protein
VATILNETMRWSWMSRRRKKTTIGEMKAL